MGMLAKTLKVGENMLKQVSGYSRKNNRSFGGTLQKLNGKTVCHGKIEGSWDYTRISTQLPNGGSKTVSRAIPSTGLQREGDLTKVTTVQNAKVGGKNVQTVNKEVYEYGGNTLITSKYQTDSFSGGKRIITNHTSSSLNKKNFLDSNNILLKTVFYDKATGLRRYAELPDGRKITYNSKGLPVFSTTSYPGILDLGGLDKLI